MKLKAIRAHFLDGRTVKVGETYEVADALGNSLVTWGKAERAPVEQPKPPAAAPAAKPKKAPMTTETAKPLIGGLED